MAHYCLSRSLKIPSKGKVKAGNIIILKQTIVKHHCQKPDRLYWVEERERETKTILF